jgi:hypothetical protein
MSEARINSISNENNTGGPTISGITTFSGLNFFVPPKGTTAQRPSDCPPGSVRFNTDSAHLEYFDGLQWLEFEAFNTELNGGARGIIGGGYQNAPGTIPYNIIDYVTISTLGNAIDFGDKIGSRYLGSSLSSSTRGVWAAGSSPATDIIEYVTISSTGDAIDFGDVAITRISLCACSNSTRGIIAGGSFGATRYNIIEYITISSTGNAQDFGDLSAGKNNLSACSSPTRGIFGGGIAVTPATTYLNVIEYITISSTGDVTDFGDLSVGNYALSACSNSTRGVFGGGFTPTPAATYLNVIEYITISSTGNAIDFGELSVGNIGLTACSSSTRGIFGGGNTPTPSATFINVIEYITISSTGDAIDFGDLTQQRTASSACSNGHGGL